MMAMCAHMRDAYRDWTRQQLTLAVGMFEAAGLPCVAVDSIDRQRGMHMGYTLYYPASPDAYNLMRRVDRAIRKEARHAMSK